MSGSLCQLSETDTRCFNPGVIYRVKVHGKVLFVSCMRQLSVVKYLV
jgi:hypothetical protein